MSTKHGLMAHLEPQEVRLLHDLAVQVRELFQAVRDDIADFDDPVIARLFPPAYDNDRDAEEFRRFTAGDGARIREANQQRLLFDLRLVRARADKSDEPLGVIVARGNEHAWLAALADLRLVLHTRVSQGAAALHPDLDESDLAQFRAVLEWLGYAQATMLDALDSR